MRRPLRAARGAAVFCLLLAIAFGVLAAGDQPDRDSSPENFGFLGGAENTPGGVKEELKSAAIRLPIAAILGTLLALRPRRRGTPPRHPAVIQTQIVLAIVGAVIMLVVGASLARAFGIVGVASLIRYRSKIDDPKDAVVMLGALAVGLAAGCGLLVLGGFGTLFLTVTLWVIESFELQTRSFELAVKFGEKSAELRPKMEAILRRFKTDFELRGSSEEEVSYFVTAPIEVQTDRVSNALMSLVPEGKGGVEWKEKSKAKNK
ncbi:MAG TPA: DUF4956 domain-containing protein [Candidatus Polarisedimenticolia bacterium]|nr:DUF4956 domain-containing protein [Candidatus Polarisedimenticolia bacterium]